MLRPSCGEHRARPCRCSKHTQSDGAAGHAYAPPACITRERDTESQDHHWEGWPVELYYGSLSLFHTCITLLQLRVRWKKLRSSSKRTTAPKASVLKSHS